MAVIGLTLTEILIIIGFSLAMGGAMSLLWQFLGAKLILSSKWFADRMASKFLSTPYVKMTTGKLLKQVVKGVSAALEEAIPDNIPDFMDKLPQGIKDKIPKGVAEKVISGEIAGIDDFMSLIPGALGGEKTMGGIMDIFTALQGLGGLAGSSKGSSKSKKYRPGG